MTTWDQEGFLAGGFGFKSGQHPFPGGPLSAKKAWGFPKGQTKPRQTSKKHLLKKTPQLF